MKDQTMEFLLKLKNIKIYGIIDYERKNNKYFN